MHHVAAQADDFDEIDIESPSSSSGSTYASDVQSHFFHIFGINKPMTAARIRTDTWAAMHSNIRFALGLHRHEVQAIHMVNYRPQDLYDSGTLVAIVQRAGDLQPGDLRQLVLIDVIFHGHTSADFQVRRYAMLLRKDTTRRILLEELHLQPYCASARQACLLKLNNWLIPLANHALFELHHGDYLRIDLPPHPRLDVPTRVIARCLRDGHRLHEIQRIYDQAETDFEWEPLTSPDDTTEAACLLQTSSRRQTAELVAHTQRPGDSKVTISLDQTIPMTKQISVDLSPIHWMSQSLLTIQLDIWTAWPDDFELPTDTAEQLSTLSQPSHVQPTKVHFYVDGSNMKTQVGAGIACLIEHDQGMFLAGCLSKAVRDASHAFQGEHAAMVWALIWAIHISTWHGQVFGHFDLEFTFNFDAMNTGYQAAGYWRTKDHTNWRTLFRSLAQILQRRHQHWRIQWDHVKAHSQHPLNDLVDSLAKYAASRPDKVEDCAQWWHWLHDEVQLNNIQWLWYLEHLQTMPHDAPQLQGQTLIHHQSSFDANAKPKDESAEETTQTLEEHCTKLSMTLATANVLTLMTEPKYVYMSKTKQQVLQRQFHEAKCTVIGLQETRHKKLIDPNNEWYHVLGHAADPQGGDGVQMWFSKQHPIDSEGTTICLQDLRIVASAPNLLIVKLHVKHINCVFVTGRAPHAGRARAECTQFWRNVSGHVSKYMKDHLLFFLGDTNGHLGDETTVAVGEYGGTRENGPGQEFHNWMLEHGLFAPSTFVEFHRGDRHATFCSPDGQHESRIDYVAVPMMPTPELVSTWVDDTIDLCGPRIDHLATLCHYETQLIYHANTKINATRAKLNRHTLREQLNHSWVIDQLAYDLTTPPWSADPHVSAEHLAHQVYQELHHIAPGNQKWRRKEHVPEQVWAIVDFKKFKFQQLKALHKTARMTTMRAIFSSWKANTMMHAPLPQFDSVWLKMHDHVLALTQHQYRQAALQATNAIRVADAEHYQRLAADAGHAYTHEGLTSIWKKIKAVLPKNRMKQRSAKFDIECELQQHFADLEAGVEMPFEEAVSGNVSYAISETRMPA